MSKRSLSLVVLVMWGTGGVALADDVAAALAQDFTEVPSLWTCGAEDWGPWTARCAGTDDRPADGKYAIVLNYCMGQQHYFAFPKWRDADWDLTDTEYLAFKVKFSRGTTRRGPNPIIYLRSQDGSFVRIRPAGRASLFDKPATDEWTEVRVPLTPDPEWEQFTWFDGSLQDVDFVEICFTGGGVPKYAAHHVLIDDVHFGPEQPTYTPPNPEAADIDVLFIERNPTYERYQVTYENGRKPTCENADKQHYPDPGETVTYTAHVQNKGKSAVAAKYVWILDGQEVAGGEIKELEPQEKASFDYEWSWDPAPHELTFKTTPAGEDYCPRNDALMVRTDALLLKHVVERGTQAHIEQKTTFIGSYSFEDWLQQQARFLNQLFEKSKYPFAPEGIKTRVAIGKIEYVEDGYIAKTCEWGPFEVGEQDIRYDGGRGCTMLDTFWDVSEQGRFFLNFENFTGRPDGAWLHEMSHQLGIIDNYQFITEPEDNAVNGVGFTYDRRGLMGGGEIYPYHNPDQLYCYYAPGDVAGYNATYGKRRGYFGEYLYCIPKENALVIIDAEGRPIADAEIKVYQTDDRKIDTTPEFVGRTDARGRFALENRPAGPLVTETGVEIGPNPFGRLHVVGFNGVFLVTVDTGEQELYGFTDVLAFNVAWAAGHKDKAEIPVVVQVKGDERTYTKARPMPDIREIDTHAAAE